MEKDIDIVTLFHDATFEVSGRKLEGLTLDTQLSELALDSVMVLEVVSHVEQSLGVRFDDDDLNHIQSLSDLDALAKKLRQAA